jgi:hypothetical protein
MSIFERDHNTVPGAFRYQAVHCPFCGKKLDGTKSDLATRAPISGDYSICAGCHLVAVWIVSDLGVSLRKPTPAEQHEIDVNYADMVAHVRVQMALSETMGWQMFGGGNA